MLIKYLFVGLFFLIPLSSQAIIIDSLENEQFLESDLEAVKSSVLNLGLVSNKRINAIGGSRKLLIEGLAGSKYQKTRLAVFNKVLTHSQDAGAISISRIIWDGDRSDPFQIKHRLSDFNITADHSSKFILKVLSFDTPKNAEVNLEITVYSGANIFAKLRKNIPRAVEQSLVLEFPFKHFTNNEGKENNFDFSKISAIELQILGLDSDIDLQIGEIKTDSCTFLPFANNQVVDACGICNGNNACIDCRGVINGSAKKDRCNVCNGDGTSCLGCTSYNQSTLLTKLDTGSLDQAAFIKNLATRILKFKNTPQLKSYLKQQKIKAEELKIQAWQTIWQIPATVNTCSNQIFCALENYQSSITEYQKINIELKKITDQLIIRHSKINPSQKIEENLKKKAELLYLENNKNLASVVVLDSNCIKN